MPYYSTLVSSDLDPRLKLFKKKKSKAKEKKKEKRKKNTRLRTRIHFLAISKIMILPEASRI